MTPTPTAAKVPPVVFVIDDDASVRAALRSLVRSVGLRVCPDTLGRITKFSKHEPN